MQMSYADHQQRLASPRHGRKGYEPVLSRGESVDFNEAGVKHRDGTATTACGWLQSLLTWMLLLASLGCYVQGMTLPVLAATSQKLDEKMAVVAKNNVNLIRALLAKNNVSGAVVLIVCVVLIPFFKFGCSVIVLLRSRCMTSRTRSTLVGWLSAVSPYQFNDILLACAVVAYVNLDVPPLLAKYVKVSAFVQEGFWWFLGYCLLSMLTSKMLEGLSHDDHRGRIAGHDPSSPHLSPVQRDTSLLAGGDLSEPEIDLDECETPRRGPKFMICACIWAASLLSVVLLPLPPLSSQIRAADVTISDQEASIAELFVSLATQDPLLACLVMLFLVIVPALVVVFAVVRIFLDAREGATYPYSSCRITIWKIEQFLQSWALGEVAGLALSSYYVSAQDRDQDFITMCTRIPWPPVGFALWIAMAVASWGIRHYAPKLGEEEMEGRAMMDALGVWQGCIAMLSLGHTSGSQPPGTAAATRGGALHPGDVGRQGLGAAHKDEPIGGPRRIAGEACHKLPLRAVVVWALWCVALVILGPSSPSRGHSVGGLNKALTEAIPKINALVQQQFPTTVGDCVAFEAHCHGEFEGPNSEEERQACKEGYCLGHAPLRSLVMPLGPLELESKVLWATGVRTMQLASIVIIERRKPPVRHTREPAAKVWNMEVVGVVHHMNLWNQASVQEQTIDDGYFCCVDPFHFRVRIAAECDSDRGFLRHSFRIVDVEMTVLRLVLQVDLPTGPEKFSVELVNQTNSVKAMLQQRLQRLLDDSVADQDPGSSEPSVLEVLNSVVSANFGGEKCPQM